MDKKKIHVDVSKTSPNNGGPMHISCIFQARL